MRKLLAIGLAAVFVSGSAVALTAPAAGAGTSTIEFGACPADLAGPYPELTCATVRVPLDYRNPSGAQVDLLVSRRASTNPDARRGVLFVNPGGPGGSGSERAGRLTRADAAGETRLPKEVLDAYDIIGMDPRGVALSDPITCVEPEYWQVPAPNPNDPANRDAIWTRWQTFADRCAQKDPRLAHLGTRNVARDMDRVLTGLGESKLNYLGYSYGTYLGAVYASMYPNRVDRMVLDSNMNPEPEQFYYRAALAQTPAMQQRVLDWFDWIARYDTVFELGDTAAEVRAAWLATLADFSQPHGTVGVDELLGAVFGTMYSEAGWEPLAHALADHAVRGDDTALVEWATPVIDEGYEHSVAAFSAVMCVDAVWPTDRAVYERDAAELAEISEFAWYNTSNGLSCADWPAGHERRMLPSGKGLPPILMFNSVHDPATPYAGAQSLHRLLPTSVLVTEQDSGRHGVFASPVAERNVDAQRIGANYLVDGVLPGGDITIPGHPLPVPTKAATTGRATTSPVAALPTVE